MKVLSPGLPGPQTILLVHLWGCFEEEKGDPEQVAGARPDSDIGNGKAPCLSQGPDLALSAGLVSQNLQRLPFWTRCPEQQLVLQRKGRASTAMGLRVMGPLARWRQAILRVSKSCQQPAWGQSHLVVGKAFSACEI